MNTKQNYVSNESTDLEEDVNQCQQVLEVLEQRQNKIAAHYMQKINRFRDILSKQSETKNELSK